MKKIAIQQIKTLQQVYNELIERFVLIKDAADLILLRSKEDLKLCWALRQEGLRLLNENGLLMNEVIDLEKDSNQLLIESKEYAEYVEKGDYAKKQHEEFKEELDHFSIEVEIAQKDAEKFIKKADDFLIKITNAIKNTDEIGKQRWEAFQEKWNFLKTKIEKES